eukprot:15329441-Ditylum_brightwellii.AAC.1
MTAAETEELRHQHKADLATIHTCKNTDKALKKQLLTTVEDIYISAIKEEHIGYTNQSVGNILGHVYNTDGTILSTMLTLLQMQGNQTTKGYSTTRAKNCCNSWTLPRPGKTLKYTLPNVHTELQEMQSAAQELNYRAGIVNNAEIESEYGIREQTANALQALVPAMADE